MKAKRSNKGLIAIGVIGLIGAFVALGKDNVKEAITSRIAFKNFTFSGWKINTTRVLGVSVPTSVQFRLGMDVSQVVGGSATVDNILGNIFLGSTKIARLTYNDPLVLTAGEEKMLEFDVNITGKELLSNITSIASNGVPTQLYISGTSKVRGLLSPIPFEGNIFRLG